MSKELHWVAESGRARYTMTTSRLFGYKLERLVPCSGARYAQAYIALVRGEFIPCVKDARRENRYDYIALAPQETLEAAKIVAEVAVRMGDNHEP